MVSVSRRKSGRTRVPARRRRARTGMLTPDDGSPLPPVRTNGADQSTRAIGREHGMWRLRGQRAKGIVTVRAEWHEETRGQHRSEVRYGTFSCHIALPVTADARPRLVQHWCRLAISWAYRTGLRSPRWSITRSRDVFAPRAAGTIGRVQCVAFAVPLLPGQAEAVRIALASCRAGARKEACQDARRRAGIIREAVWIQPGPGGDVAVVYLEADDLAAAFTIWGTSAEPFDRWFRGRVRQVHGIALEDGFTAPELVLDYDTGRI